MRDCRYANPRIGYLNYIKQLSSLFLTLALLWSASVSYAQQTEPQPEGRPFSHDTVSQLARELSQQPFKEPEQAPKVLTDLDYSTYRQINFQQDAAIWGKSPTRFRIQLFAPGFLFKNLVDIDVVENGMAFPIKVSETSFSVPNERLGKTLAELGKYAGVRLHYPINRDEYKDEFIVFQGASYFRAVSKGQVYGLSARGLAIDVAQPKGEEHPLFKRFWIERPSVQQTAIVVHALLDSPSVTGAYRFGIYPGAPTRVNVDVTLFSRRDIQHAGLAPLTSMYMYGPMDPPDKPDYRPAVHDSDALVMVRGNGEQLWRPVNNPRTLQVSAFLDENPKGFGLIQSHRRFDYFQDLEAKYHRRPSAWVEPLGDWGKGQIELFEIPSDSEANDNIVAYWKPADGLKKGVPFSYSYRLTWPDDAPLAGSKGRIARNAGGLKLFDGNREVVVDYSHIKPDDIKDIKIEAGISKGSILESRIEPNPEINGARVFAVFDPKDADVAELRLELKRDDKPVAPTWLYRWTRD